MLKTLAVILLLLPGTGRAVPWDIVGEETRIEVDVGYLGSVVTLEFETVRGEVDFDADRPETAEADIAVAVEDVETGLGIVNALIKSVDYLDVRGYPEIGFRLDRLEVTSASTADIFGSITMLGTTRPIIFKAKLFRYAPMRGDETRFDAGFDLKGLIDRRQFGNSTGFPDVSALLPVRIRLLLRSRPPA